MAIKRRHDSSPTPPRLTDDQILRYSRQLVIPEVGEAGQLRLLKGGVLVIGVGGLGTSAAGYLAAAGVGRIGVLDDDEVEPSNLQRQLLYTRDDVGKAKARVAQERLKEINSDVLVQVHKLKLDSSNAMQILSGYDVIVDGTDNFPSRYLISDACSLLGKPDVFASALQFDGQLSVFDARVGPCYRCVFPSPPPPGTVPSCSEAGVLAALPGILGGIQAAQAINLLLGLGSPLVGRLLVFDAAGMSFTELKVGKNPSCPICGPKRTITRLIDYEDFCGLGANQGFDVEPEKLKELLDGSAKFTLLDVREPYEYNICHIKNSTLIPVGTLPQHLREMDKNADIVVYCHTGARSSTAVRFMRNSGFKNVRNLRGGIEAWAERVDPAMPRY